MPGSSAGCLATSALRRAGAAAALRCRRFAEGGVVADRRAHGLWRAFWIGKSAGASPTPTASAPPATGSKRKWERCRQGSPLLYLPNGIAPPAEAVPALSMLSTPTVLLFSRFVEVDPAWMGAFWQSLQQMTPNVRIVVGGQALQPTREAAFRAALKADQGTVDWVGFVSAAELTALLCTGALCHLPRRGCAVESGQV